MKLETVHGVTLDYDERALRGAELASWTYATVDVERRRVILFAHDIISVFRCGSHKELKKCYEARYGEVKRTTGGRVVNGVLHDTVVRTQKRSYHTNCVTGEQRVGRDGWKYNPVGDPTSSSTLEMVRALTK
jgi:hypothetical protein